MKGHCVVYYNLKPRKIAGIESNGMVLCCSNKEHSEIELLKPPQEA